MLTPLIVLRAFASGSVGLRVRGESPTGVRTSSRPSRARRSSRWCGWASSSQPCSSDSHTWPRRSASRPITPRRDGEQHAHPVTGGRRNAALLLIVQVSTAVILLLAANKGFKRLPEAAIGARRRPFMPPSSPSAVSARSHSGSSRWPLCPLRSVGVRGKCDELVPLYTIGSSWRSSSRRAVWVRRWWRLRNPGWRLSVFINSFGYPPSLRDSSCRGRCHESRSALDGLVVLRSSSVCSMRASPLHDSARRAHADRPDEPIQVLKPPVVIIPVARLDRATLQGRRVRSLDLTDCAGRAHRFHSRECEEFPRRWRVGRRRCPST